MMRSSNQLDDVLGPEQVLVSQVMRITGQPNASDDGQHHNAEARRYEMAEQNRTT